MTPRPDVWPSPDILASRAGARGIGPSVTYAGVPAATLAGSLESAPLDTRARVPPGSALALVADSSQLQQAAAAACAGDASTSRLVQHSWPSASPFGVGLSARTV